MAIKQTGTEEGNDDEPDPRSHQRHHWLVPSRS
jgi:hypothetical protein